MEGDIDASSTEDTIEIKRGSPSRNAVTPG
jgi:hypothetical protein